MKEGSHVSDYDRAIADYNGAIRIDPKVAFRNRGLVFFYSGDFEEAIAAPLLANDLKDDAHAMLALSCARAPGPRWRSRAIQQRNTTDTANLPQQ
jgi:tetratricopeptide (TPR) repeat protein